MEHLTRVLFDIFLIFASAKLLGELFERFRQPAVVGEVLAGLLLGPYLLGIVPHSPVYEGIAEIGVIFLLFTVGLETKPSDILKVGVVASKVGLLGILLPFVLGFGLIAYLGHPTLEALFIGTALVATSVGITARVLGDMGLIQEIESRIILGAAVIDDIIGMILLAVVSSLGEGALSWVRITLVAVEAIAFTLFLGLVGSRVINRYGRWIERIKTPQAPLVFSILICLGLSALSSAIGMAAIIGAFMAGMVLAEFSEGYHLVEKAEAIYAFLVPFFFFVMGSHINLAVMASGEIIWLALVITVLAVVGKLVGCGIGALSLGRSGALIVGVGMVPRGEVGIIVAMLGLRLHAIPESMYALVIFMSVVTTLAVPPVLRVLFRERLQTREQATIWTAREKAG
ncbi:MAG: cation:proton antiporter [candidate division NC10 bacterium]|nr:cation:proton antiporter [candidate division NC10 bacterium]